jgi:ABC-type transport system involved in cytochrome c biogenesis permease component
MKYLNRIPKSASKVVLTEIARAHLMIAVLSLGSIMLTFIGVLFSAVPSYLGAILIVLLLNTGIFSLLVAWRTYLVVHSKKK